MTDPRDGVLAEPTEQRRRLAALLVRLREATGRTQTDFGARVPLGDGLSQSKVSRLERGAQMPTRDQAEAWAAAAGASADQREQLLDRLEAALTEAASLADEVRHGVAAKQRRIARVERAASVVRTYAPIVPGLLQTAEYTRRLFEMQAALLPEQFPDIAAGRAAWAERQQVLFTPGGRFQFVVPEAALWWHPGPDADLRMLAGQLRHIANLSTLDTVRFGIVPYATAVRVCVVHQFTIVGEPGFDDHVEVTIQTITHELHLRDDEQIATYLRVWDRLCDDAVFDDEARDLLATISSRLLSS
ncbi:MAG: helix-turn-helix domain-containing protein [Egibacteraceae bacterium]